jgi:hypothetical protein
VINIAVACAAFTAAFGTFRRAWRYQQELRSEARFLRRSVRDILDQDHL